MAKQITMKDIKSGYVVELRNGSRYIAIRVHQNEFIKGFVNKTDAVSSEAYDETLHYVDALKCPKKCRFDDRDIVKIWGLADEPSFALNISDVTRRPLLWERPPVKKMTITEIEKALGYSIDIVEEG